MQHSNRPLLALAVLLAVDGVFVLLHLLSQLPADGDPLLPYSNLYDLDAEIGLATWWAQTKFTAAAAVCGVVAWLRRRGRLRDHRYWAALVGVFLLASADEASSMHEKLAGPTRDALEIDTGPLYFAWIVPMAGVAVLLGLVFFRFWLRLPAKPRFLLALAAVLFVGGAMGVEMFGAEELTSDGRTDAWYLSIAVEEGLEMLAVSLLVHTTLSMAWMSRQPASEHVRAERPTGQPGAMIGR